MSERSRVEGAFAGDSFKIDEARKRGSNKLRSANRERALVVRFGSKDKYAVKDKDRTGGEAKGE